MTSRVLNRTSTLENRLDSLHISPTDEPKPAQAGAKSVRLNPLADLDAH